MPKLKTSPFDVASVLTSREVITEYLNQCYDPDNLNVYLSAISDSIRATGIDKVSGRTKIPRDELVELFKPDGNPTLIQTIAVFEAMGLRLSTTHAESVPTSILSNKGNC